MNEFLLKCCGMGSCGATSTISTDEPFKVGHSPTKLWDRVFCPVCGKSHHVNQRRRKTRKT